jgi:hypothetical protein
MVFRKNWLTLTILLTHSLSGFAAMSADPFSPDELEPKLNQSTADVFLPSPEPVFTTAQLIPAYKIGLKRRMFEILGGVGHIDGSVETDRGQSTYIKKTPQTDYIPVQLAYGLTDNTSISFSGRALRTQEKVANTNIEGTAEPQFSVAHTFRNENQAVLVSGTYSPDVGPQTNTSNAATRTEGNALAGGSSGQLDVGYYNRIDPVLIGGEISYLYKNTRIINRQTLALFTGLPTGQTQTRLEGGHEKTLRGVIEYAGPVRLGVTFGRTWVEQEEEQIMYQLTTNIHDSYFRNFMGAYGRFQVNPRLSVLPSVLYSEAPDTSSLTSNSNTDLTTQVNLRFRF